MTKSFSYTCKSCGASLQMSDTEDFCLECYAVSLSQDQQKSEQELHEKMDSWWNNLSVEDRERAFFSVIKRLYQAECVDKLSYRQVLSAFGLGDRAYALGIICNMMNLHQKIINDKQVQYMVQSQCDVCSYQSLFIKPEDNKPCEIASCDGMLKGIKNGL